MAASTQQSTAQITWHLIWCYERCYKQDCQAQRELITATAQAAGASLVLLKKARNLKAWMEHSQFGPFVLVTDWREAQPAARVLLQQRSPQHVPTDMIVLCEGQRQYLRALNWTEAVSPSIGRLHICERSSIPEGLLDGLVKQCFTPVGTTPTSHAEQCQQADADSGSTSDDDLDINSSTAYSGKAVTSCPTEALQNVWIDNVCPRRLRAKPVQDMLREKIDIAAKAPGISTASLSSRDLMSIYASQLGGMAASLAMNLPYQPLMAAHPSQQISGIVPRESLQQGCLHEQKHITLARMSV
mmetsp:Transcript_1195/g.2615  ORF Transcript_1195/g.2615 Transcript_1195/m.2615 type:complete len:300 (-) Transcript_1195:189-1088(-)